MFNNQTVKDERPIDEGITTATLAGIDERQPNSAVMEERETADDRYRDRAPNRPATTQGDLRTSDLAASANRPVSSSSATATEETAPLFPASEATDLRGRWDAIQVGFVDEPRNAVEQADALVAGAMKRMAEIFAEERARLEGQWDRGDSVSTEDLRLALRRYRSFFGRVLSV